MEKILIRLYNILHYLTDIDKIDKLEIFEIKFSSKRNFRIGKYFVGILKESRVVIIGCTPRYQKNIINIKNNKHVFERVLKELNKKEFKELEIELERICLTIL